MVHPLSLVNCHCFKVGERGKGMPFVTLECDEDVNVGRWKKVKLGAANVGQ